MRGDQRSTAEEVGEGDGEDDQARAYRAEERGDPAAETFDRQAEQDACADCKIGGLGFEDGGYRRPDDREQARENRA